MTRIRNRIARALFALTFGLPLFAQFEAAAVVRYTAEEVSLGFTPFAMNNRGWIVGASQDTFRPMRYRPGVGTEQISSLDGRLLDINDAGTAVGYLLNSLQLQAIIRPAGAAWRYTGTLGSRSEAHAINEAGQVVGRSLDTAGNWRPFLYTEAGGIRPLFAGNGEAIDINESGQVTGNLYPGTGGMHGFLWDPVQGLIDIDTYPGVGGRFTPGGIADNGKVVGTFYQLPNYSNQVATFSLTEGLRITGPGEMTVSAVNKRAWAVGRGRASAPPFLYVYGQGVRSLSSLLTAPLPHPLAGVIDINDRDEILAYGGSPLRYYILKRVR